MNERRVQIAFLDCEVRSMVVSKMLSFYIPRSYFFNVSLWHDYRLFLARIFNQCVRGNRYCVFFSTMRLNKQEFLLLLSLLGIWHEEILVLQEIEHNFDSFKRHVLIQVAFKNYEVWIWIFLTPLIVTRHKLGIK